MKQKKLLFMALFALGLVISCSKDDGPTAPKNTAPVIEAQTFSASENISDATTIGTVKASDADKGDKLTFSIKTDAGSLFEITGAGALSLASGKTLDFATATAHDIVVSVSDGTAASTATITINVTEVKDPENLAPVIEDQVFEAAEDIADTEVIGTVVATDPENAALTFSITDESGLFEITTSGALSLIEGETLDFETNESHTVTVSVTDGNSSASATITIKVLDPDNGLPVIEDQEFNAAEDIADTEVIGTVVATDPEDDALIFSITADESDLFEITESGELSLADGQALDFETSGEHTVTVSVTDGNGSASATITITVTKMNDDPDSFVTVWNTDAPDQTIEIGVDANLTYDYTVDWGDGTVENIANSDNPEHTYQQAGSHLVAIKGLFPAIRMVAVNDEAQRNRLVGIAQWGANPWASMLEAFSYCEGLVYYTATDVPDLSQVTNMSYMFEATSFNGDLSGWDTGNVTDMEGTFYGATSFNGDLSGWDTGNVTDMRFMFYEAGSFNGDLSGWDTGNVTNMGYMFYNAGSFEGLGVSGWDTGNVTNMRGMFSEADSFYGELSGWDTGNVTNMQYMFKETSSFNADISGWDVSNVTNMGAMFAASTGFDRDLSGWDIGSVTNMVNMLNGSGLSPSNYGNTLFGWASYVNNNNGPNNIILGAEEVAYCTSDPLVQFAHDYLTNTAVWTISDAGGTNNCN